MWAKLRLLCFVGFLATHALLQSNRIKATSLGFSSVPGLCRSSRTTHDLDLAAGRFLSPAARRPAVVEPKVREATSLGLSSIHGLCGSSSTAHDLDLAAGRFLSPAARRPAVVEPKVREATSLGFSSIHGLCGSSSTAHDLDLAAGRFLSPAARRAAVVEPKAPEVQSPPKVSVPSDSELAAALKRRQEELAKSKKRKFRVHTKIGFLNVHMEPGDPHRVDNVVARLYEGQIVTGIEEENDWVLHDGGGWSIRYFGGFEWLRPIDEQE